MGWTYGMYKWDTQIGDYTHTRMMWTHGMHIWDAQMGYWYEWLYTHTNGIHSWDTHMGCTYVIHKWDTQMSDNTYARDYTHTHTWDAHMGCTNGILKWVTVHTHTWDTRILCTYGMHIWDTQMGYSNGILKWVTIRPIRTNGKLKWVTIHTHIGYTSGVQKWDAHMGYSNGILKWDTQMSEIHTHQWDAQMGYTNESCTATRHTHNEWVPRLIVCASHLCVCDARLTHTMSHVRRQGTHTMNESWVSQCAYARDYTHTLMRTHILMRCASHKHKWDTQMNDCTHTQISHARRQGIHNAAADDWLNTHTNSECEYTPDYTHKLMRLCIHAH